MINRFILNEVSYFGPGAREVLPKEIARLGLHKALVVTDKDLIKFGVADKVLKVLETASVPYEVFSDVKPNPTVANVKAGLQAFAASGADFILAIGGGSSIDTSKAIGIITNNPEFSDVVSLEGVADTKNKSVPIIALPTTAGTAAEVTINYVITDEANEKKMVCVDPNDIPVVAVVDAEFVSVYGLTANNAFGLIGNRILVYVQIVPDRIGHVSGSGTIILIRSTFCQCNGRNDPVVFEVIDNIFAGQFDQHFFFICPRETCGIEMRQFTCLFFFQYFVYGFPYGDDLLFSCFGIDNE